MSPFVALVVLFVLLAAGSLVLLRRSVRRGEELFAVLSAGVVVAFAIYVGGHSLLAATRGF